jgi:putative SOS response-associated peptidase YedK
MCGPFTRIENLQHLAELLGLKVLRPLHPCYNIAPSQLVACVRINFESMEWPCVELKWGLIPSWVKDASTGNKLITA